MSIWLIVLGVILLWIAVLVVRALLFHPKKTDAVNPEEVRTDPAAAARLAAMIRVPTVSHTDRTLDDETAFDAFPTLLESLYPKVHAACTVERIGARALLMRWPGRVEGEPVVLMAHYDVVPAEADLWQKPPFAGVIEDGVLWGRGTLDTKCTVAGILEAAEALIAQKFVPEHDVLFAFGGDEEIGGGGAPAIVETLKLRGIRPSFVLDEGGAVVASVFPGVAAPSALIGIGEKGNANATFTLASKGGHASAPPPHSPVGILAKAVGRVENKPFPFKLTKPAHAMFDTLGRHAGFPLRLIFGNLWCFWPVLNIMCKKSGGEMNALVRTTAAFTQMKGSDAPNVLPPAASVTANMRIIGGETMESARRRLIRTIDNPDITVTIEGRDPSPTSRVDGAGYALLSRAIRETWPQAIVSPYLMIAGSDSRHYAEICERVYRFSPVALTKEERQLIHGRDERIPVDKLATLVAFYQRLMKNL